MSAETEIKLACALREMLSVYWQANKDGTEVDGGEPPEVVVRARAALADYEKEA